MRVDSACSSAAAAILAQSSSVAATTLKLETGVGRALNLALAAMPGFTLPGDTSASARYFEQDLTQPFELASDGTMAVPSEPGIGVTPLPDRLLACVARRDVILPPKE